MEIWKEIARDCHRDDLAIQIPAISGGNEGDCETQQNGKATIAVGEFGRSKENLQGAHEADDGEIFPDLEQGLNIDRNTEMG